MRVLPFVMVLAACVPGRPCERHEAADWSEVVPVEADAYDAIMQDGVLSEAECFEVCGGAPDVATLVCEDWSTADGAEIFCSWTQAAAGIDCE
jgi:hypothetical protein